MKNFAVAGRGRTWPRVLVWSGLIGLVAFQAWAFACRLPLSLGPRVVLQPWLLQHGSVLYENIADQHSPLMSLSLTALRPLLPDGLRLAMVVLVGLISISTILLFRVGSLRIGSEGGLWAALFFVAWSPLFVFGKLWYESFLTPLYLVFALWVDPSGIPRSFRSRVFMGFFGGTVILFKQHAVVVLFAAVAWDLFDQFRAGRPWGRLLRETGVVGLAATVPAAAYAVFQYSWAGTLKGFVYWTIGYNAAGPYASMAVRGPTLRQVMLPSLTLLLLPAAVYCIAHAKRRRDPAARTLGWWITLLAASVILAYPRFSRFRFQPALPLLALISSLTVVYLYRLGNRARALALGLGLTMTVLCGVSAVLYYGPAILKDIPLRIGEYSPLVPLAEGIRNHIGSNDRVYIFPDEEPMGNLYYLLRRPTPGFWIFHLPWFMTERIRSRILATLEEERPDWVIYAPNRWGAEARAPDIVGYILRHYRKEKLFHIADRNVWLLKRRVS